MKSVTDYINSITEEGEAMPTNTVSGGAIATKDVPLGKVQKRKPLEEESGAYEGENPLADAAGKFPLLSVQAPELPPESDEKHMFKAKQQYQNDQVMSYD